MRGKILHNHGDRPLHNVYTAIPRRHLQLTAAAPSAASLHAGTAMELREQRLSSGAPAPLTIAAISGMALVREPHGQGFESSRHRRLRRQAILDECGDASYRVTGACHAIRSGSHLPNAPLCA